jgi:hypothetical protein
MAYRLLLLTATLSTRSIHPLPWFCIGFAVTVLGLCYRIWQLCIKYVCVGDNLNQLFYQAVT